MITLTQVSWIHLAKLASKRVLNHIEDMAAVAPVWFNSSHQCGDDYSASFDIDVTLLRRVIGSIHKLLCKSLSDINKLMSVDQDPVLPLRQTLMTPPESGEVQGRETCQALGTRPCS